jgi:hypothetical protein
MSVPAPIATPKSEYIAGVSVTSGRVVAKEAATCLNQCGCVVDTVADHGHHVTCILHSFHNGDFVRWENLGMHIQWMDTGLGCDG